MVTHRLSGHQHNSKPTGNFYDIVSYCRLSHTLLCNDLPSLFCDTVGLEPCQPLSLLTNHGPRRIIVQNVVNTSTAPALLNVRASHCNGADHPRVFLISGSLRAQRYPHWRET